MRRRFGEFRRELCKNRALFVMLIPAIVVTIIFSYLPMSGLVVAFKNYRFDQGIFGSEWNGLENFRFLFASGTGLLITKNTIYYNLMNLITSQALSIVIAIFITEINNKAFKKVTQSVIFLPYFVSWVIVGTFAYALFNYENGLLNNIMTSLGGEAINYYGIPGAWKYIIMMFNSWKWCGYNSVIYIAAIMGIDAEIYEAAASDGATIFQRIRYITIPGIRPTIITMILLQVGRIMRGDFEMFYQIVGNNGQLYNATDVIDTYVFRSLLQNSNIGMTGAASFYQSTLCLIIVLTVNAIVKHIDADYALF